MWTLYTDVKKNKHAIAVHLSLAGRARKASSELSVDELNTDDGMKNLVKKLDRVFLQDANWKCFNTYLAFENYRRPKDSSIDAYLSEFDLRHYKLKECGVTLPDAVVACRLLKSCGLSDMHFQLALSTTAKMTFEHMRCTLKKLFSENKHLLSSETSSEISESVKVEPIFASHVLYGDAARGRSLPRRGSGFNSARIAASGSGYRRTTSNNRNNPFKPDGTISLCAICGSKMHWAKQCPHAYERQPSTVMYGENDIDEYDYEEEEVHITLLAMDDNREKKMDTLLGETIGSVLLDSGCSKTVCGKQWLLHYLDTLDDIERKSIKEEPSKSVYRFGDGKRMTADRCISLPCVLADRKVLIRTDVVDGIYPCC